MVRSLADGDLDRLHDAIVKVLGHARQVIRDRKPALHEKIRDFLQVRGRQGEPCPRCGAKLRRAGVHGHDAIFCPECQPDGRRSAIVDWRNAPKPVPQADAEAAPKPKRARKPR
jgi:formamidopyrimidine-DNA glycosylase